MRTYTLPIAETYVQDWGVWEGVRELLQNAMDERDGNGAELCVDYDPKGMTLMIWSKGRELSPRSLVLGASDKGAGYRGRFGEGYKLAALALIRAEKSFRCYTGCRAWDFSIDHDPEFDAKVLKVNIRDNASVRGVQFIIGEITPEEWELISERYRPELHFPSIIEDEPGVIFVGGLWVCDEPEYKAGYNLSPQHVFLDRDRRMVRGYDLGVQTSKLWAGRNDEKAMKLINEGAADVEYLEYAVPRAAPVYSGFYGYWAKTNPDTVPVTTDEDAKRAANAGMKWKLVPHSVMKVLSTVKSWIIPDARSPVERLRSVRKRLDQSPFVEKSVIFEIDDIIQSIEKSTGR